MNCKLWCFITLFVAMMPGALSGQWLSTNVSKEIDALVSDGINLYGAGYDTAVYRSTNGGVTWSIVENQGGPGYANGLSTSGGFLYACANTVAGVYRSSDRGATWKFLNRGLNDDWAISIAAQGPIVYVGEGDTKIFRSTDSGETWMESDKGMDGGFVTALQIVGSYVFAGTGSNGIYRSSDSGVSWHSVNNGIPAESVWTIAQVDSVLFAGIENGSALYGEVYRSSDRGNNWVACSNGWTGYGCASLFAFQHGVFAGTLNGVEYSDDLGGSWNGIGSGIFFVTAFAAQDGNLLVGTEKNGIYRMPLSELSVSKRNRPGPIFQIDQNYPNPINSKTTFSFIITHNSTVTITIIDPAGRETMLFPLQEMDAGAHEITCDFSKFPAGIYAYRLTADGESLVRKMAVIH